MTETQVLTMARKLVADERLRLNRHDFHDRKHNQPHTHITVLVHCSGKYKWVSTLSYRDPRAPDDVRRVLGALRQRAPVGPCKHVRASEIHRQFTVGLHPSETASFWHVEPICLLTEDEQRQYLAATELADATTRAACKSVTPGREVCRFEERATKIAEHLCSQSCRTPDDGTGVSICAVALRACRFAFRPTSQTSTVRLVGLGQEDRSLVLMSGSESALVNLSTSSGTDDGCTWEWMCARGELAFNANGVLEERKPPDAGAQNMVQARAAFPASPGLGAAI